MASSTKSDINKVLELRKSKTNVDKLQFEIKQLKQRIEKMRVEINNLRIENENLKNQLKE